MSRASDVNAEVDTLSPVTSLDEEEELWLELEQTQLKLSVFLAFEDAGVEAEYLHGHDERRNRPRLKGLVAILMFAVIFFAKSFIIRIAIEGPVIAQNETDIEGAIFRPPLCPDSRVSCNYEEANGILSFYIGMLVLSTAQLIATVLVYWRGLGTLLCYDTFVVIQLTILLPLVPFANEHRLLVLAGFPGNYWLYYWNQHTYWFYGESMAVLALAAGVAVLCTFFSVRSSRSVVTPAVVLLSYALASLPAGLSPTGLSNALWQTALLGMTVVFMWRGRQLGEFEERKTWLTHRNLRVEFEAKKAALAASEDKIRQLSETAQHLRRCHEDSVPTIELAKTPRESAPVPSPSPSPSDADQARVLTVPAMPALKPTITSDDSTAPNALLAAAMRSRGGTDWKLVDKIATNIQSPGYSLRNFHDDAVAAFPELRLFFVEPPPGGAKPLAKPGGASSSGDTNAKEYQRTMGALFAVYWLMRLDVDGKASFCYGVDDEWRPRPPANEPPSVEGVARFFKLKTQEKRADFYFRHDWSRLSALIDSAGCNNKDGLVAILCLTAVHDIFKITELLPRVLPQHAPYRGYEAGDTIHDHDLALAYMLEHHSSTVPTYHGLPEASKKSVLFTQSKLNFNHGWFVQAEAPPGMMLSTFKEVVQGGASSNDISLYFFHWITDLSGALAKPLDGAGKFVIGFPHHVLHAFLWSIPFLAKLASKSETEVVEEYLRERWAGEADMPLPRGRQTIALLRLVVMAQARPQLVIDAFNCLADKQKALLSIEMARTGSPTPYSSYSDATYGPAFLVYYGPALLQLNSGRDVGSMSAALGVLHQVYGAARLLWPASAEQQSSTVKVNIAELKAKPVEQVIEGTARTLWIMARLNQCEAAVQEVAPAELNALQEAGTELVFLDFWAVSTNVSLERVAAARLGLSKVRSPRQRA